MLATSATVVLARRRRGRNKETVFKIFDYDIPIDSSTYLSFWMNVQDSAVDLLDVFASEKNLTRG